MTMKAPASALAATALLLCGASAAAGKETGNVLVDMFAWWNGAIKREDGFTKEGFARYFTDDAAIVVNNRLRVRGVEAMVEHFRRIQARTDAVEIVLPFEEGFREGDKIFTYHLIRAREDGKESLSHVMGYAVVEGGKLALVNFLSYAEPPEPPEAPEAAAGFDAERSRASR